MSGRGVAPYAIVLSATVIRPAFPSRPATIIAHERRLFAVSPERAD